MSHGTDATVERPVCGGTFDPSVSGGWCTDSACGASRVAGTASGRRRLVTDGGPSEDARAEDGDDERPEVWPDDEEGAEDEGSLVDLGQNGTVVTGEELEQGDGAPVEPGDRTGRSDGARTGVGRG